MLAFAGFDGSARPLQHVTQNQMIEGGLVVGTVGVRAQRRRVVCVADGRLGASSISSKPMKNVRSVQGYGRVSGGM
jgi:hypothetical protein